MAYEAKTKPKMVKPKPFLARSLNMWVFLTFKNVGFPGSTVFGQVQTQPSTKESLISG